MKESDENMLTLSSFRELKRIHDAIETAKGTYEGTTYRLKNFCVKNSFGNCVASSSPLLPFETVSGSMFDLSGLTSDADVVKGV